MLNFTVRFAFLALVLATLQPALAQSATTESQNIIFIMADDLGYETLGCNGNDINKTPHLDKLAAGGMRFTHAHSTPLCTPTRVQVMTGKYNHRNYTGFGLLDRNEKTFGTLLKNAGYVTGVTGKWQLLGNKKQQELAGGKKGAYPQEVGFDKYCLWQVDQLGSRYKDPLITTPEGTKAHPGKYGPDIFKQFALDFIEDYKDEKFFLYYPMVLTHDPFQPTPAMAEFTTSGVKLDDPVYFKPMVEYADMIVGEIAEHVRKLGLSRKTVIIFVGDNGTGRQVISTVNGTSYKGGKGSTTRGGTHVPMIVSWEGGIKAGTVNNNLIDFTDFLPTFMDLAGAPLPTDFHSDGKSFYRQLTGESTAGRDWIFCDYYPRWYNDNHFTWAHDKNWKLYSDDRFYDLQTDPDETKPLEQPALSDAAKTARAKLDAVIKEQLKPVAK